MNGVIIYNSKHEGHYKEFLEGSVGEMLNCFRFFSYDKNLLKQKVKDIYGVNLAELDPLKRHNVLITESMKKVLDDMGIEDRSTANLYRTKILNEMIDFIKGNYTVKGHAKTWEHVVPCEAAAEYLLWAFENKKENFENLVRELFENANIAFVTFEDDQKLNDAKLKSSMPNGLQDLINKKWWARYEVAGIKIIQ